VHLLELFLWYRNRAFWPRNGQFARNYIDVNQSNEALVCLETERQGHVAMPIVVLDDEAAGASVVARVVENLAHGRELLSNVLSVVSGCRIDHLVRGSGAVPRYAQKAGTA